MRTNNERNSGTLISQFVMKKIFYLQQYSNLIEIKRNVNEPSAFIKDTIIVDETNSEYKKSGPVPDNCEYLKWSKKEGLIEYRLRDGTVYPR